MFDLPCPCFLREFLAHLCQFHNAFMIGIFDNRDHQAFGSVYCYPYIVVSFKNYFIFLRIKGGIQVWMLFQRYGHCFDNKCKVSKLDTFFFGHFFSFSRSLTSSVTSASSMETTCGAVNMERTILSPIVFLIPFMGILSSRACISGASSEGSSGLVSGVGAVTFLTYSSVILPPCPVPLTFDISTPSSLAMRLVDGVAKTLPGIRAGSRDLTSSGSNPEVLSSGGLTSAGLTLASGTFTSSPGNESEARVLPTFIKSPSFPTSFNIFPAFGEGISTMALSVSISAIAWSALISSPSFTSHLTIVPSVTPSPTSGNFKSTIFSPQKAATSLIASATFAASGR